MKHSSLLLRDNHGASFTMTLTPRSESALVWPRDQLDALVTQMQSAHPDVYLLHHRWHQSVPEGTSRKQTLRLFYEHNLRERFSPVECRRLAEEILGKWGLNASWLNESWHVRDDMNGYYWAFLLAALLQPRAVMILAMEKELPLVFSATVSAWRERGVALIWCSHVA